MHESTGPQKAAFFVDDGGLDACEFDSNYIWFRAQDPNQRQRAWQAANDLWTQRVKQHVAQGGQPCSIRKPVLYQER